jgi:hypothetical protein
MRTLTMMLVLAGVLAAGLWAVPASAFTPAECRQACREAAKLCTQLCNQQTSGVAARRCKSLCRHPRVRKACLQLCRTGQLP